MSVVFSVHLQFLSWSGVAVLISVVARLRWRRRERPGSHRGVAARLRNRLRGCYAALWDR